MAGNVTIDYLHRRWSGKVRDYYCKLCETLEHVLNHYKTLSETFLNSCKYIGNNTSFPIETVTFHMKIFP